MSDSTDVRSVRAGEGRLAGALTELAGLLLSTSSFAELMQQIAALSTRIVPDTLTCGITLSHGGRVITVASADRLGNLLDEQQYDLDQGPCLEALETSRIVDAPDLSRESRWGGYPQQAMTHGVSAVYSTPLRVRGDTIGAVNLYGSRPGVFDGADQHEAAAQLSALTAVAITGTLRNYDDVTLTSQLQTALDSRAVIDQAVGIVMATQRCTADQAFTILRGISQTRNIRMNHIARDLVDRTATSTTPHPTNKT